MGASYGTAKSSIGLAAMGVLKPHLVMKSLYGIFFFLIKFFFSVLGDGSPKNGSPMRTEIFLFSFFAVGDFKKKFY
jgi:hypothetical protein